MLKKKERLTRKEFDRSFAAGKRIHSPYLQLIFAPSESFHGSVVVGKKVAKKAVDRNKLRRQIYGQLYRTYKEHPVHMTFIIIAKKGFATLDKVARTQEVLELLSKAPKA